MNLAKVSTGIVKEQSHNIVFSCFNTENTKQRRTKNTTGNKNVNIETSRYMCLYM